MNCQSISLNVLIPLVAAVALGDPVLLPDPDLARVTLRGAAVDLSPSLCCHLTHHHHHEDMRLVTTSSSSPHIHHSHCPRYTAQAEGLASS